MRKAENDTKTHIIDWSAMIRANELIKQERDDFKALLQELVEAKENAGGKFLADYVSEVQRITKQAEAKLGGKEKP